MLFERTTIIFRNFAIGSSVAGDIRNITFRDSIIGDDKGSAPWAIKIKTDSQEGGIVDGVHFINVTLGNITFCGSSEFVSKGTAMCDTARPKRATAIDINMGYVGAKTNPGIVRNISFSGFRGIGPDGSIASWNGLPTVPGWPKGKSYISGITVSDFHLKQGGPWVCSNFERVSLHSVSPFDRVRSTCPTPAISA